MVFIFPNIYFFCNCTKIHNLIPDLYDWVNLILGCDWSSLLVRVSPVLESLRGWKWILGEENTDLSDTYGEVLDQYWETGKSLRGACLKADFQTDAGRPAVAENNGITVAVPGGGIATVTNHPLKISAG